MTLHADGSILHVDCTATGFPAGGITGSHIHMAPSGVNGPVVFAIGPFNNRTPQDFSPTAAQVADLTAGNYYVNYHSAAFPGGEIRGQLRKSATAGDAGTPPGTIAWLEAGPNPMHDVDHTSVRSRPPAPPDGWRSSTSRRGQSLNELEAPAPPAASPGTGAIERVRPCPAASYFARLVSGRGAETVRRDGRSLIGG